MSDAQSVPVEETEIPSDPSANGAEKADAGASSASANEEIELPVGEEETAQQAEEVTPDEEAEQEVIEGEVIEGIEEEAKENELEALQAELEQAQVQAAEYLDGWQRARAEFANYKKRVEAEREELRRTSTETLLLKLLPVVDDFERAFQVLPEDSEDAAWVDGFKMILRKLQAVLESQDVARIEAAGQPFDPIWHQAVMQEETDEHPDGYVIEEMQRGYRLGERVLRPSMVKVASNTNERANELEKG
jgi:molecular chaperone GrpE